MNKFAQQTLAKIVTDHHETATVFEKYGLDFCCKGKRTLETACEEKHIPVATVASELESVIAKPSATGFDKMNVSELVEHIEKVHHEYVRTHMPQILAFLERIAIKHGSRHPELVELYETFIELRMSLEEHMLKEEKVLFPRIKEIHESHVVKNADMLETPVDILEDDHEEAGRLMDKIRKITGNFEPPADACNTYRLAFSALKAFEIDLHQHVHLENNILFPKALSLTNPQKAMNV